MFTVPPRPLELFVWMVVSFKFTSPKRDTMLMFPPCSYPSETKEDFSAITSFLPST